jgi:drug/metabolite transporter (DMT)-like permease
MTTPGDRAAHRRGVLLMIAATACWSTAGVLVRNMDLRDSWEITFWRSLFMTAFILALLRWQYPGKVLARVRAVGRAGAVAGALWALMYICFITALGYTTVANVLVLSSVAPFTSALLGRLFLREQVTARTLLAMTAAFAGIVVMFMDAAGTGGLVGNLIALIIPIAFAVNVTILRGARASVDMIPTLVLSGLLSMAVCLPFALPLTPSAKDLGLLAIMGIGQVGLGAVLMIRATPHLTAAEVGLIALLEIIFGSLSTWLAIGERPGASALTGGAVVIAALLVNELFGLRRAIPAHRKAAVPATSRTGR